MAIQPCLTERHRHHWTGEGFRFGEFTPGDNRVIMCRQHVIRKGLFGTASLRIEAGGRVNNAFNPALGDQFELIAAALYGVRKMGLNILWQNC
jgi:hypothetical protein